MSCLYPLFALMVPSIVFLVGVKMSLWFENRVLVLVGEYAELDQPFEAGFLKVMSQ